jgi:hypothetical protein
MKIRDVEYTISDSARTEYMITVSLLCEHDYTNPDNDIIVRAYVGAWFWHVNISRGCVKSPRKVLSRDEKRKLVAGCRKVLRKLGT